MDHSTDWVVDCSDDEMYSDWQTEVLPNGKVTKRPKEQKVVQLYQQLESGQLPYQLSWKREYILVKSSQSPIVPLSDTKSHPQGNNTKEDTIVNQADPSEQSSMFGFDEDTSDCQLDSLRHRFYSRKDRTANKAQVTFDSILQDLSRKRKR